MLFLHECAGVHWCTRTGYPLHDASNRALEELENELGMSTESSASFGGCSGEGKFSPIEKSKFPQFCISLSVSCSSEHDLLDLLVDQGGSYHAGVH